MTKMMTRKMKLMMVMGMVIMTANIYYVPDTFKCIEENNLLFFIITL